MYLLRISSILILSLVIIWLLLTWPFVANGFEFADFDEYFIEVDFGAIDTSSTSKISNTVSASVNSGNNKTKFGEVALGKSSASVELKTVVNGETVQSIKKTEEGVGGINVEIDRYLIIDNEKIINSEEQIISDIEQQKEEVKKEDIKNVENTENIDVCPIEDVVENNCALEEENQFKSSVNNSLSIDLLQEDIETKTSTSIFVKIWMNFVSGFQKIFNIFV